MPTSPREMQIEEATLTLPVEVRSAELLRNRQGADSYHAGTSSLATGLKYSAIFGHVGKSQPFFENALHFLKLAGEEFGCGAASAFNPRYAYRGMRLFWGLYGVHALFGETSSSTLDKALGCILPAFSDLEVQRLKARLSDGSEELSSVSVVELAFLGLAALAELGGAEVSRKAVENAAALPVDEHYRGLRNGLVHAVLQCGDQQAHDSYCRDYQKVISIERYSLGLISGLTLVEAWLLSAVKENGDVVAASERLLWPESLNRARVDGLGDSSRPSQPTGVTAPDGPVAAGAPIAAGRAGRARDAERPARSGQDGSGGERG